jgi:[acyl-carrier-protein] S-malonyltransferase
MATGLLFSGQGAQYVGMGHSLYAHSEIARALYDQANEVLGWDLKQLSFSGPDAAITETKVCQPALYVHGYALYAILKDRGLLQQLKVAFGLSLGEVTALAVAGVFDFATGLKIVAERGRLMQQACEATAGGMASVIGGSVEAVEDFCTEFEIQIANLNCPGQIVVSGEKEKVLQAVANSKGRGFKLVKALNVAGAYHSRLMHSACEAFSTYLGGIEFQAPQLSVYTNVTGAAIADPAEIKAALVQQVVSTVRFEDCLRNASEACGVSQYFECGPARVLAGLARRTDKSFAVNSLSEYEDLDA